MHAFYTPVRRGFQHGIGTRTVAAVMADDYSPLPLVLRVREASLGRHSVGVLRIVRAVESLSLENHGALCLDLQLWYRQPRFQLPASVMSPRSWSLRPMQVPRRRSWFRFRASARAKRVALGREDVRVMDEPIDERRRELLVAEDLRIPRASRRFELVAGSGAKRKRRDS
jgi:hypothetical protein